MTDSHVVCTVEDGLVTIMLNTPPLNLISVAMTGALATCLTTLATDPGVRALLVHGAGDKAFCGGSDIREFGRYMHPGAVIRHKLAAENAMYSQLAHFPWPTVAAVQGGAWGGGLELALCCDLIVADPRAVFALPEVRLGVFPGSGGTVRTQRRIGYGRAAQMIFLGDPITADTALSWGLINAVPDEGGALNAATALARRLAKGPLSQSHAKQALIRADDLPEQQTLGETMRLIDLSFNSEDCREGVAAFRAKRPPEFRGR